MKRHVWIAGSLFTIMILSAASMVWAPPKGDVWLMKHTPLPSQRVGFATSAVNGKIYAIGGSVQAWWDRKHLEEFNSATDTWDTMAAMPEGRSGFSTSVVDEKIFVFASYREFRRTVLIYTPPFRTPRSVDPVGKVATTWGRVKTGR